MPLDWEGWLSQWLSDLLAKERTAELLGEAGDPELAEKLEAILDYLFELAIAPHLEEMANNCAGVEQHGSKALGWLRTTQLVGWAPPSPPRRRRWRAPCGAAPTTAGSGPSSPASREPAPARRC